MASESGCETTSEKHVCSKSDPKIEHDELKLRLITWNVADQGPPGVEFATLLGSKDSSDLPDVIGIGLQEVCKDSEWKARFNQTLSHEYCMIKARNIWAIWNMVFVLRKHLPNICNIESEVTASGVAGVMGNKGGCSIRFDLYGVNTIFVNSHFTAHITENKERINDYMDIIESQHFRDPDVDVILDHDYVFWFGDLNFRMDELPKDFIEDKIARKEFESLWPYDQLRKTLDQKMVFVNFREGKLSFPPTFKFDLNSHQYDTSKKQRKPAWTDRILYMTHEEEGHLRLKQTLYGSLKEYTSSDHRPVVADFLFKVSLRNPPLPAEFAHVDNWKDNADGAFRYRVNQEWEGHLHVGSWDWIALLRENFDDFNDYVTYVYVPTSDKDKVSSWVDGRIERRHFKGIRGRHLLMYFSKRKNCPIGYSNAFNVRLCKSEPSKCSCS